MKIREILAKTLRDAPEIIVYLGKIAFSSLAFVIILSNLDENLLGIIHRTVSNLLPYWYDIPHSFLWLLIILVWGILVFGRLEKMSLRYANTVKNTAENIYTTFILFIVTSIFFLYLGNQTIFQILFPDVFVELIRPYFYILLFSIVGSLIFSVFYRVSLKTILKWLKEGDKTTKVDDIDISDEPIESFGEDLLQREEFVSSFLSQIELLNFDSSFVFALQGDWGEGKTSVLNLLSEKIEKGNNLLLMKFQPWFFDSTEQLLKGFIRDFELTINDSYVFPSFKKTIYRYKDLILFPLKAKFQFDWSFLLKEETLDDVKIRLSKTLARLDKKIVIFIDDLDRLSKDEALQVLKLVKLISNFPNTIFVLSFDHQILNDLVTQDKEKNKYFLDKIVQKVLYLPKADQKDLDDFLDKNLEKLLLNVGLSEGTESEAMKGFADLYRTDVRRVFSTLRIVKRYLNSLRATLTASAAKEINLSDLLLIEVIRVLYPKVFEDIWQNRWYYQSSRWDSESFSSSPIKYVLQDKDVNAEIKQHIEEIIKANSDLERKVIMNILSKLFLSVDKAFNKQNYDFSNLAGSYRADRRIAHPEIFRKYFMLRNRANEIPDSEVKVFISILNKTNKKDVSKTLEKALTEYQKIGSLAEFVDKIDLFHKDIDEKLVSNFIPVLYEFAQNGFIQEEEEDRLFVLVFRLINEKTVDTKIHTTLEGIVKRSKLYFAAKATNWACSDQGSFWNIKQNVDKEKLRQILSKRMKENFLGKDVNIFDEYDSHAITLLAEWSRTGEDGKKDMNEYLKTLIDSDSSLLTYILKGYVFHWGAGVPDQIRYDDIVNVFDEQYFYEKAKEIDMGGLADEERSGVSLFIKVYEERHKINSSKGDAYEEIEQQDFSNAPIIEVSVQSLSSSQGRYTAKFSMRNVGKENAILESIEVSGAAKLELADRKILTQNDTTEVKLDLTGSTFRKGEIEKPTLTVFYRDMNNNKYKTTYSVTTQNRADGLINFKSLSDFRVLHVKEKK